MFSEPEKIQSLYGTFLPNPFAKDQPFSVFKSMSARTYLFSLSEAGIDPIARAAALYIAGIQMPEEAVTAARAAFDERRDQPLPVEAAPTIDGDHGSPLPNPFSDAAEAAIVGLDDLLGERPQPEIMTQRAAGAILPGDGIGGTDGGPSLAAQATIAAAAAAAAPPTRYEVDTRFAVMPKPEPESLSMTGQIITGLDSNPAAASDLQRTAPFAFEQACREMCACHFDNPDATFLRHGIGGGMESVPNWKTYAEATARVVQAFVSHGGAAMAEDDAKPQRFVDVGDRRFMIVTDQNPVDRDAPTAKVFEENRAPRPLLMTIPAGLSRPEIAAMIRGYLGGVDDGRVMGGKVVGEHLGAIFAACGFARPPAA